MKVTAEMDLRVFIDEAKEVTQAWNEFIEKLEQIQQKYEEVEENDKSN